MRDKCMIYADIEKNRIEFRKITMEELDQAYSIICENVDWLLSKNIRQWITPIPYHIYQVRQQNSENYGLIYDDKLAVVLSLVKEPSWEWADEIGDISYWWLSTMVTSKEHRGRGIGKIAVCEVLKYCRKLGIEELYIDCVQGNDFLPNYYKSLGFETLKRKHIKYNEGVFKMVLMKCSLKDK